MAARIAAVIICPVSSTLAESARYPNAQKPAQAMTLTMAMRVFIPSHPFDYLFAEQTLRPEHEEDECEHIGEPVLGGPAHHRPDDEFEKLLTHPDDQAADDGAGDGCEAAQHQHRQRL